MNEHITKYLKHYISTTDPQYAVLLSGKWGCGKTFFINEFLKDRKNKDKKFIKVSLFGLKNISEVNNQIILQLLNIDKKWFGQIAKVAQSYTKKLNLPIQDLPINKIFNKLGKELIFIFDDLERTEISTQEILGYINYLVEISSFKAILIANEEKILEKEGYKEFKEKVIGKTFKIQQDFNTVLEVFLKLASDNSKKALTENKQNIESVYDKAKYNNLRHIRQTILDFEYFYECIDDKFKSNNNNFLKELVYLFFAFSVEVKKGKLKAGEIDKYSISFLPNEKKTNFDEILDKYSITNNSNLNDIFGKISFLIGKENWESILLKDNIIEDDINTNISHAPYFAEDNRESWVKLWHFRDLEDDEFKTTLTDVVAKFNDNEYQDQEELLHVVAILLYFSKQSLYEKTQAEILTQAENNINANAETVPWQQKIYKYDSSNSAHSLGYTDYTSPKFKKITDHLEEKSQEAFNKGLKTKSNDLLDDFKNNNIEALEAKLVLRDFNNIAIFSRINVDDFIDILLDIKHTHLQKIINILKQRYQNHRAIQLTQDLKFWQGVDKNLLNKINKQEQLLKYNLMSKFKESTLKEMITNLEKRH